MIARTIVLMVSLAAIAVVEDGKGEAGGRWSAEKARTWYEKQPWLVGCNFLPSTAVNDVEMWQKETFDAKTIDRELGWAQDLGFNTVRIFVNYAVWEADAEGLKVRFRQFLKIADRHGMTTMVILFDDCFKPEPVVGKQPDPEPGVHNSQWVQSPGAKRRGDRAAWPKLERYVKDMVGSVAADRRVLAWELYNEPSESLPLVEAAFQWAREAAPSQPVTTTVWGNAQMRARITDLSDVLCFHNYDPLPSVEAEWNRHRGHGRPVLCTEWMSRGRGSRFETHLPFFKQNKIACWNWGLVAGRTQTYFPWGSPKGAPEPALWFHDIFRKDGAPFNAREVKFIKVTTGKLPASALSQREVMVPTAEKSPVPWRYTLNRGPEGPAFRRHRAGLPGGNRTLPLFDLAIKEATQQSRQFGTELAPGHYLVTASGARSIKTSLVNVRSIGDRGNRPGRLAKLGHGRRDFHLRNAQVNNDASRRPAVAQSDRLG
jgi:hypothetical protein